MMRLRRKAGLAAGVLAAVTTVIAPAAFATSSYTVEVDGSSAVYPPGSFSGVNKGTLAFSTDAVPAVPAACTTSAIRGTIARGATVSVGNTIGEVTQLVFGTTTACVATVLNLPVVISKNTNLGSGNWPIKVTGVPAKVSDVLPIRIDNIDVKMQSTVRTGSPGSYVCELRAQGSMTGTFNRSTQRVTIAPPAGTYPINSITAYDGSGVKTVGSGQTCGGQIWSGDSARMTGEFTLTTSAPISPTRGINWF